MADGEVFNTRTGDNNIDGVLIGTRWNSTALTFAFPTLSTYFNTSGSGYEISPGVFDNSYVTGFSAANVAWQSAVTTILDGYARVSNLSYTLVSPSTQADVVFAMTNTGSVPTANGRFPSYGPNEGHQWYNIGNYDATPVLGTYTWATIMHETGHTMGLAHGHSPDTITAIPGVVMNSDRDSMEFSVMTYRSYIGQVINGYTNETFGYAQTLMMYDIAAIQLLYGADYTTNSGSNVYTFSTTTGEMFIDGVSQGLPGANRIFRTVWDGNGVDTFNLSNYSTNLHVDLTPGGWSTFSDVQLANLGDGNFARGNVFNSLLFNNDSRSLIENVVGGTGDDTIVGNRAANNIQGGNGSDTIVGGGGGDTIIGGAGIDIIYGDSTAGAPSGIGLGTGIYNHGSVHDTIATAFNLTNTFSTANNANIVNSTTIPHTTMHYSSAAGDLAQFYAVTLTAGSTITLDIDATTGGLDSYIRLLAADGTTILAFNDDGAGDVGSTGAFDSSLTYTVAVSGVYYISVGQFSGTGTTLPLSTSYDLNVSVTPPPQLGTDGTAGNDVMNGGVDADQMFGGAGNDTYYVDNIGDVTSEAGGSGTADFVFASVSFAQALGIDRLYLTGVTNINATGNALQNDFLVGNSGNNVLNGLGGADVMRGGLGNDAYIVDNIGDTTDEVTGGGGTADFVYASVSFRAALGIERLYLTGATNINATGNALQNDFLWGNSGNNVLNGLGGADVMRGGLGNDTYFVDNIGDTTDEVTGGGGTADFVFSSVSYVQALGIERLYLTGATNINATGNAVQNDFLVGNSGNNVFNGLGGNDVMRGGLGNDVLIGGLGNDTLTGDGGSDIFRFNTVLNAATNRDLITDFVVVDDTIQLENAIFAQLFSAGVLAANLFKDLGNIGAVLDGDDRIIYNHNTGNLSYDADGSGVGLGIQFATLSNHALLLNTDFVVI